MKIAHLMSHKALNGVATSTKTLIELQMAAGHEVALVCRPGAWLAEQPIEPAPKMLTSEFSMRPSEIRSVGYALRDWGAEVVHAHSSRANKVAMVFRIVAGSPVVMTAHARQFQIPWAFATEVLAPSRQTADYYARRGLVRRSRLHVVPHPFKAGAAPRLSPPERAAGRSALGLSPGRVLLGSVGEVCARKNQVDMLRMLETLVAGGLDAELLLVGPDGGAAEMAGWSDLVRSPLLRGRLHMAGERQDVPGLLPLLDAYLCTALVEEGPIASFEAMAACVPVLSYDVGFTAEVVPAGRVVAVGDHAGLGRVAAALLRDPVRLAAEGARDRDAILRRLSPDAILPRIDAVYAAALAHSRAAARVRSA